MRCARVPFPFWSKTPAFLLHIPPPGSWKARVAGGLAYPSFRLDKPMAALARNEHFIRYAPNQYDRYLLDFTGSFEDYLAGFKSKSRGTLKRKVKKYEQQFGKGQIWRRYSSPGEIDEFFDLALEVSSRTYQERLLNAGLPKEPAFREDARRRAKDNAMRGYILWAGEKPISYLYGRVDERGVFHYDYLGYDSGFHGMSPGTVLHYYAIQDMFSDGGLRYFDFSQGQGQHKATFGRMAFFCADIYFLPATFFNLFMIRLHHGLKAFSARAVGILAKSGLKSRVKNLLRRRG